MKKYKCISKCLELDEDNSTHCIVTEEWLKIKNKYCEELCPCGNKEEFILIEEESVKMKELIKLINRFIDYENFSIQDFKYIKEDLEKNNLDTESMSKFIDDISERCNKFIAELANKFNSLSEEQIKSIDILNENNIKYELQSDWYNKKQDYTYKVVINSKEDK